MLYNYALPFCYKDSYDSHRNALVYCNSDLMYVCENDRSVIERYRIIITIMRCLIFYKIGIYVVLFCTLDDSYAYKKDDTLVKENEAVRLCLPL